MIQTVHLTELAQPGRLYFKNWINIRGAGQSQPEGEKDSEELHEALPILKNGIKTHY